jgi:hypothetical protein
VKALGVVSIALPVTVLRWGWAKDRLIGSLPPACKLAVLILSFAPFGYTIELDFQAFI